MLYDPKSLTKPKNSILLINNRSIDIEGVLDSHAANMQTANTKKFTVGTTHGESIKQWGVDLPIQMIDFFKKKGKALFNDVRKRFF